jgi:NAD(P)-dependent dehydrogenase (short-subunit alcohol dehydrogenase family)
MAQKRVAIVTGAGSGIGKSASLALLKDGYYVGLVGRRKDMLEETAAESGATDRALVLAADITKDDEVAKVFREVKSKWGRLDVLFNNAGIMHHADDGAVTTGEDIWDLTMNINAKGVFLGCKYGIPALQRAGGGSVINTASFVAVLGAATPQIAYTASKGAVLALTRELAVLHAKESIRVNALCPGPLQTELLMSVLDTEEKRQRRLVHLPMGRFGEPAEIARAALFLASDDSSYVTGTDFLVDGGLTAAYVTAE